MPSTIRLKRRLRRPEIRNSHTVALLGPYAIDEYCACCGHQVHVVTSQNVVPHRPASFEAAGEKPSVGSKWQGLGRGIFGKIGCEDGEAVRASTYREGTRCVRGRCAEPVRRDPNLEKPQRDLGAIEFGVSRSRSCAHDLNITGSDLIRVAQRVLMGHDT